MAFNIRKIGSKTLRKMVIAAVPKYGNFLKSAPGAWEELHECIYKENLVSAKTQLLGVSFGRPFDMDDDQLSYLAAVTIDEARNEARIAPPLIRYEIEGGNFEVFRYQGPYQNLAQVFGEILEKNKFNFRKGPFIEMMINTPETARPEELLTDIYIPVV